MTTTQTLSLIESIYQYALEPSSLPDMLTMVSKEVGGIQECLFAQTPGHGYTMLAPRRPLPYIQSFQNHWLLTQMSAQLWERLNKGLHELPCDQVVNLEDLFDTDTFTQSAFYRQWWLPQGLGLAVLLTKFSTPSGSEGIVGIHSSTESPFFSQTQRQRFSELVPHLNRAVALQHQLALLTLEKEAYRQRAGLQKGMILVDENRRPIYTNKPATDWLARNGPLTVNQGRLHIRSRHTHAELLESLDNCQLRQPSNPVMAPFRVSGKGQQPQLELQCLPFQQQSLNAIRFWLEPFRPTALILITDLDQEREERKAGLGQRFGLTRTEATLAVELLEGGSRSDIADRMGISLATVRTHLTRLFDKTGVRRQTELVRLLSH